jgi:hypothetical protein
MPFNYLAPLPPLDFRRHYHRILQFSSFFKKLFQKGFVMGRGGATPGLGAAPLPKKKNPKKKIN